MVREADENGMSAEEREERAAEEKELASTFEAFTEATEAAEKEASAWKRCTKCNQTFASKAGSRYHAEKVDCEANARKRAASDLTPGAKKAAKKKHRMRCSNEGCEVQPTFGDAACLEHRCRSGRRL